MVGFLGGTFLSGPGSSALPSDNARVGLLDYNDLATATTPINVPSGLVNTKLTNDGLGPFTNKAFTPNGVTDIWDASNNRFDWQDLGLGDLVDIRLDVEVTTSSPNQLVQIDLNLGTGGSSYGIPFASEVIKSAGAHRVTVFNGIYMGDANTLNNFGEFVIRSDGTATLVVFGWYCKVLIRG